MDEATEPASTGWFDAHVLFGVHPSRPGPPADTAALVDHLRIHRLSGALVTATASWLHDPLGGNAVATSVAAELADLGVQPCWTAVPPTPGELDDLTDLVDRAVAVGVAAFRLWPTTHGYDWTAPELDPLYRALAGREIPLAVAAPEVTWGQIDAVAGRHPDLTMIISELGYRELRMLAAMLRRHPRLVIDMVNFSSHRGLEWLVTHFGAARVLFASGWGLRDPAESLARLAWSELGEAEIKQIGSGTAAGVFAGPGRRRSL